MELRHDKGPSEWETWLAHAEKENPDILEKAGVVAFQTLRQPIVSIPLMVSGNLTDAIHGAIRTAYDGIMEDMRKEDQENENIGT